MATGFSETAYIYSVIPASANLCAELELNAQLAERQDQTTAVSVQQTNMHETLLSERSETPLETVGDQIDRLRDECDLSIEELAEKMDIHPTNVSRHIHGESNPSRINLIKYNRLFSKLLNAHIVIKKTQPKRS